MRTTDADASASHADPRSGLDRARSSGSVAAAHLVKLACELPDDAEHFRKGAWGKLLPARPPFDATRDQ